MMNLEKINNFKFLMISVILILIGYSINLIGWNIGTVAVVYFGLGLFFLGIISFIILLFLALIKIVNRI